MYESLQALDPIKINFSAAGMHAINIVLGFIMFGIALSIHPKKFIEIMRNPKSTLVGMVSQLIVLPALTFLLVIALYQHITPTVALGMILIAACPGGNISNFMSSLSKANTELSISLTAATTLTATIATPFNFALWGGLYLNFVGKRSAALLPHLHIDNAQMFQTVFILLGVPLILGVLFARFFPKITQRLIKPIRILSIVFFLLMVVVAFSNNLELFLQHIFYIFIIVLIHNTLALCAGFGMGTIFRLPNADRRTLTLETGIQNSGLGLVLLFNPKIFPPDMALGGMLFVAAWWGIWHIMSGLAIASVWHRKKT